VETDADVVAVVGVSRDVTDEWRDALDFEMATRPRCSMAVTTRVSFPLNSIMEQTSTPETGISV